MYNMSSVYRAIIVCAWGEMGAAASDKDGQVHVYTLVYRCTSIYKQEELCMHALY